MRLGAWGRAPVLGQEGGASPSPSGLLATHHTTSPLLALHLCVSHYSNTNPKQSAFPFHASAPLCSWGGHGRTGTLLAVMLGRLYGVTCAAALRFTQAFHDSRKFPQGVRSPQTNPQVQQVRRWVTCSR